MGIQKTSLLLIDIEKLSKEFIHMKTEAQVLPNKLSELKSVLDIEVKDLDGLKQTLSQHQEGCGKLNQDITNLGTRKTESEERLTQITNQKEYQAAVKEVEAIKFQLEQREEQVKLEEERMSSLEKTVTEQDVIVTGHQKTFDEQQAQVNKLLKGIDSRIGDTQGRIDNLLGELPDSLKKVISKLETNKIFPFTADAQQNHVCGACHMSYPPQLIIDSVKTGDFQQCPNCFRILVPGTWAFETA